MVGIPSTLPEEFTGDFSRFQSQSCVSYLATMWSSATLLAAAACCLVAGTPRSASAFWSGLPVPPRHRTLHRRASTSLGTHINADDAISASQLQSAASTILASDTESWRQYVPLAVSVGVIVDILLGSPLANLALGPMRRASEKGASGDSDDNDTGAAGGGSLFSAFGGLDAGSGKAVDRSKERVDSEAIARAALDKASGTLELRRFLDENKTDEQRYEEVRREIDKQMDELDDDL